MNQAALPRSLLMLTVLLSATVPADAAMYQWTAPDGSIGLTDDPGRIPEPYRSTARPYHTPGSEFTIAPPVSDAPPALPATPPAEETPAGEVDLNGHDRAWWEERIASVQVEQTALLEEREEAQEKLNQVQYLGNNTVKEMQEQQALQRRIKELDDQLAQIDRLLTDGLPDEARKAGAPPGWLRN